LPAWQFGPNGRATTPRSRPIPSSNPAFPPHPPPQLFPIFLPLSFPSLSLLPDTLDDHLVSAEVLAQWGVPATLGWFILSAESREQQLSWTARTTKGGGRLAKNEGDEGWERLLRESKKLRGAGSEVQGAFGMLEEVEIVRSTSKVCLVQEVSKGSIPFLSFGFIDPMLIFFIISCRLQSRKTTAPRSSAASQKICRRGACFVVG
jgi:hypothetical protein